MLIHKPFKTIDLFVYIQVHIEYIFDTMVYTVRNKWYNID